MEKMNNMRNIRVARIFALMGLWGTMAFFSSCFCCDLSICGYLYFPDEIDVSWSDYPAVGEWLERIQSLPGWAHPYDLMPGHPLPS